MSPFLDFLVFATLIAAVALAGTIAYLGMKAFTSALQRVMDSININTNWLKKSYWINSDNLAVNKQNLILNGISADNHRAADISRHLLNTGGTNYIRTLVTEESPYNSYTEFMEYLDEKGYSYTVLSEMCELNNKNCNVILQIVAPTGETCTITYYKYMKYIVTGEKIIPTKEELGSYMQTRASEEYAKSNKSKKQYTAEIVEPSEERNLIMGSIECVSSLTLLHHPDAKNKTTLFDDLIAALTNSGFNIIQTIPKSQNAYTEFHHVEFTKFGPVVRSSSEKITVPPVEVLNNMYSPVKIKYKGENHYVKMGNVMPVFKAMLSERKHFALHGPPGTGKTSLLRYFGATLYRSNTLFVYVSPQIIARLAEDFFGTFERMLETISNYAKNNEFDNIVIGIDEAERLMRQGKDGFHTAENTLLLQALDGEISRNYPNISYIMIYNADIKDMDPAFFRSGRIEMTVEMKAISKDAARKCVPYLLNSMPNYVFDEAEFNAIVSTENKLTNGEVYAREGFITIADLTKACIRKVNTDDVIRKVLTKASSESQEAILNKFSQNKAIATVGKIIPKALVVPTHEITHTIPVNPKTNRNRNKNRNKNRNRYLAAKNK